MVSSVLPASTAEWTCRPSKARDGGHKSGVCARLFKLQQQRPAHEPNVLRTLQIAKGVPGPDTLALGGHAMSHPKHQ
jgi:hypothetical protein